MGASKTAQLYEQNHKQPSVTSTTVALGEKAFLENSPLQRCPSLIVEEETEAACCSSSSEQSTSSGHEDSALNTYRTVDGIMFDRLEIERDQMLKQIPEWSFPIFRFAERHKNTVLTKVTTNHPC